MLGQLAIADRNGQPLPAFSSDPYPFYSRIRVHEPVRYEESLEGWLVTKHCDVRGALSDTRLSADRAPDIRGDASAHQSFVELRRAMLMFSNPPRHTRIRRALFAAMRFNPEEIRALVAVRTELLLDACAGRPEIDLIADLATPLPIQVLAARLGIPPNDAGRISTWASTFNLALGRSVSPNLVAEAEAAASEFAAYVAALLGEGGREHGILHELDLAVQQGLLEREEMIASSLMLVSAGRETITDFIGNALYLLCRNPVAEASLRQDPSSIPRLLDELLRLDSPVQLTRRETKAPVSIGGCSIEPGERVIPVLGAANHDPAVFPEPGLMIARAGRSRMHLAFGAGWHRCPGANLARIEAAVAIRSVLERLAPLQLCESPAWKRNPTFRGVERLLVVNRRCGNRPRAPSAAADP